MRQSQIKNITLHFNKGSQLYLLSDKINELHVQVIANRLSKSGLTTEQKIIVTDNIISNIKSHKS